ncbi:hypothetical protein ACIRPX_17940 [Streptomyces sp. NPDC101225]|uniref:hypothetical protein n=1 Tax=Streptomyces sp. NPDC101225 TaxID=3366135 RepID=UPI0037F41BCF
MKYPSEPSGGSGGGSEQDDQARGASEAGSASPPPGKTASLGADDAWIVLALLPTSGAAERSVVHLGRAFRRTALQGQAGAFIVTRNGRGAFQLVQSRFVTASGVLAAMMNMSVSVMLGFHGLTSAFRGAKAGAAAVRAHNTGVGAGAERVRELLNQAGEHGAGLVIRCPDDTTARKAEDDVARYATDHWRGSRSVFIDALAHRGGEYDWLRPVAGEPAHRRR